jgi:hypothetical protein
MLAQYGQLQGKKKIHKGGKKRRKGKEGRLHLRGKSQIQIEEERLQREENCIYYYFAFFHVLFILNFNISCIFLEI